MASQMDRTQMKEVPAPLAVEPLGKIYYWDMPDGSGRMVRATILMEPQIKVGIARATSWPTSSLSAAALM